MGPFELFFEHSKGCDICCQHPQSVGSFHYEPMCGIGRNYATAMRMFKTSPAIAGPKIYVQNVAGFSVEDIVKMRIMNNGLD